MKTFIWGWCCFLCLVSCAEDKGNRNMDSPDLPDPPVTNETPELKWQWVTSSDGSELIARHEAAFVTVGSKFFLLGGRGVRPVSIFDTDMAVWSDGSEPPIEIHHFQPVVYEDKIYIIGGMTGPFPNETPLDKIYIYEPATDIWLEGDEIPEERRRGSTGNILHNGKIYMACGIKNGHVGDHKNWLDRYDPLTGEWEILSDAPRPRDHFQAVLADDNIYLAGGRNTGKEPGDIFAATISEVDVYDVGSDTWTTLSNTIPTERAGTAAILFDGKVVIAGGESPAQEKAHDEVEALDLTTNEWKTLPNLIEGRHGTGLVLFEDELYIASGSGNRGGSPELSSTEKYGE